jgi:hypothetical protein
MEFKMLKTIILAAAACLFATGAYAGSCGVYPGGALFNQPIPGSCGVVELSRTGGMNGAGQTCNVFKMQEDGLWFAIYGLDQEKELKQQFVTASLASNQFGYPPYQLEIWPLGVADFYAQGGHQLNGTDGQPFPTTIYCAAPLNGSPGPAIPMTVVAVMYSWTSPTPGAFWYQ